jgi:hypothetical protein
MNVNESVPITEDEDLTDLRVSSQNVKLQG